MSGEGGQHRDHILRIPVTTYRSLPFTPVMRSLYKHSKHKLASCSRGGCTNLRAAAEEVALAHNLSNIQVSNYCIKTRQHIGFLVLSTFLLPRPELDNAKQGDIVVTCLVLKPVVPTHDGNQEEMRRSHIFVWLTTDHRVFSCRYPLM